VSGGRDSGSLDENPDDPAPTATASAQRKPAKRP